MILIGQPKSTNHIYKVNCSRGFPTVYMTKEGKALKESYQWQAKSQWRGKPLEGNIHIEVELYFKDKRVRDIDNYSKILLDSLTGIVWIDDKQIQKMTISKHIDKDNPRIELKII